MKIGNVFGLKNFDDKNRRFSAFTREDIRKLQVLQNKTLRLRSGLNRYTSTATLLEHCKELSVNQLVAYHTLLSVHRAVRDGKPKALFNKIKLRKSQNNVIFPHRLNETIDLKKVNLNITRGGFCYRGSFLWNMMPQALREEEKYKPFKKKLKGWIPTSIPPKPQ